MSKIYIPASNAEQWAQFLVEPVKHWKQGKEKGVSHLFPETQAICRRISTNWSSHGSRFIKKICLQTGIWLSTVRNHFQLKGLTNEN